MDDAEGHILGNFHAYYSFNPVQERLRFMDMPTSNALRRALLSLDENFTNSAATVLDIGCNEGDLTIGLYDELTGQRPLVTMSSSNNMAQDVTDFDSNSVSRLNELMQKRKQRVEYIWKDESGSSHRKHYVCELEIDGQRVGLGEGVSKKVAKAKAADMALLALSYNGTKNQVPGDENPSTQPTQSEHKQEHEQISFAKRRKLFVLGVDIDKELIARATKKPVQMDPNSADLVEFRYANVMTSAFTKDMAAFAKTAQRSSEQRQFDLVTCFSVTMWIHLNHGDDGLWKFLDTVAAMTDHLLIEPQPWKCYRNAQKRLNRLGVAVPASFRELKVRNDVVERIDAFFLDGNRFRFKAALGKTNWSRSVILYSRTRIAGITYMDRLGELKS